ncbi:hypothetical protein G7K_2553-t1 [Saitoella complicata NRRL Y-17804]|uniref:Mid2 domain-containing protein n=1 Tax=Saitoella complicata (strain BCRC 22490 / CBS 7301 / JCM 7358 / NBRC 10748 / NRRL Y-17804) TaxID=698492 RepID=A0A0E9NG67_SAICN|nr:hypothetical protein G7K_2553-t1 [Saitoella complicata NRRL Y-17804]
MSEEQLEQQRLWIRQRRVVGDVVAGATDVAASALDGTMVVSTPVTDAAAAETAALLVDSSIPTTTSDAVLAIGTTAADGSIPASSMWSEVSTISIWPSTNVDPSQSASAIVSSTPAPSASTDTANATSSLSGSSAVSTRTTLLPNLNSTSSSNATTASYFLNFTYIYSSTYALSDDASLIPTATSWTVLPTNATSDTTATLPQPSSTSTSSSTNPTLAPVLGGVLGGIGAIGIALGMALFMLRRHRRLKDDIARDPTTPYREKGPGGRGPNTNSMTAIGASAAPFAIRMHTPTKGLPKSESTEGFVVISGRRLSNPPPASDTSSVYELSPPASPHRRGDQVPGVGVGVGNGPPPPFLAGIQRLGGTGTVYREGQGPERDPIGRTLVQHDGSSRSSGAKRQIWDSFGVICHLDACNIGTNWEI